MTNSRNISVGFTRPANTTAYAAGDVIGPDTASDAFFDLSGFGERAPLGTGALLISASLLINASSVPSGMSTMRVHFYSAKPAARVDNAAFALVWGGDAPNYLGYIDLPTPSVVGSILASQLDGINKLLPISSGASGVWIQLETRGAFTPASGTAFRLDFNTALP